METASSVVKKAGGWLMLLALSFIVLGMIAIVEPAIAGLALTIWIGWLLIFGGVIHAFGAFHAGDVGRTLWQVVLAAIYLFGGYYFLSHPLLALGTLTLFLAGILFVEFVLELMAFFQTAGQPGRGWRLVNAVVTLLLGAMIWMQWPSSSIWAIGTIVGVNLIMTGFSRLMLGMMARRVGSLASA
jgi:uncharacterized membrane protein HdeD (DUF308 family)